ncbi:MAG: ATP-binding protein [Bacteroidota bacterium]
MRVLLSWSSGKDAAWALHVLRQRADVEVVGLLTTLNEAADRVAMHGVRRSLVEVQAEAAGLPLRTVGLPWPCSNEAYEARLADAFAAARTDGVTHVAFGDLFLDDVRAYRERQLEPTGLDPLFPLWGRDTHLLAREMLGAGLRAVLTCIDPARLDPSFAGRPYDADLLAALPEGIDPCGEHGEFHTLCHAGPMFVRPIPIETGETVERSGFWFADVRPRHTRAV